MHQTAKYLTLTFFTIVFLFLSIYPMQLCFAGTEDFGSENLSAVIADSSAKAFTTNIRLDNHKIYIDFDIENDSFLYKDKIQVLTIPEDIILKKVVFPEATTKVDPLLGTYYIYQNKLNLVATITDDAPAEFILKIKYQGCTKNGICHSPVKKMYKINTHTQSIIGINQLPSSTNFDQLFNQNNVVKLISTFFILGIVLSFSPCILPTLPILSGIILGQKKINAKRSFQLSLTYVFSMAMTYAIAGMLTAVLGGSIQRYMQNPYVIISFCVLLLALSAAQFGFISLKLPNELTDFVEDKSGKLQEGTYWGVAVMGVLSTLIASPCITAPLMGILIHISQTADVQLGGIALFCLGFGMGTPLIIIGTIGGKILPKTGAWNVMINRTFGFFLIALALWIFQRIVSFSTANLLWAVFFICVGLYTIIYNPKLHTTKNKILRIFFAISGAILIIYGLIVGVSFKNNYVTPFSLLYNFKYALGEAQQYSQSPYFIVVHSFDDLKHQLHNAKKQNKPTMLVFSAKWCASCHTIERSIFTSPQVKEALKDFILLKVDLTTQSTEEERIMQLLNIVAPPVLVFYNSNEVKLQEFTLYGNISAQTLITTLNNVQQRH